MKIYQRKLIERKKVRYIICNQCGENIEIKQYKDFLNINKTWGYNSNYDNENHEFELCENCYKELLDNFKIQPKVTRKKKFLCL